MKIASVDRSIERVGVGKSTRFTIEAAGKAFEILSSGLYKDKILAIVRELSTNAYDAHVAAGKQTTPFRVHLPNSLEQHFSIRDFGTGLTDEQIRTIYTTYFHSTKTNSNDFVGALGLGSKSPFSYADSFIVKSYHSGFVRSYVAFKNEDGCPDLDEIGVPEPEYDEGGNLLPMPVWEGVPTKEENGLEITVAVDRSQDYREFQSRAQTVYERFDPKPIVSGCANFHVKESEVVTSGNGWRLRRDQAGTRALMGLIAYPIHYHSITGIDSKLSTLLSMPFDIDFEMGTLEFTAGREELSYDKRITIPNLKTALSRILRDITRTITQEFESCANEFEARKLYGSYFNSGKPFSKYWNKHSFTIIWKGITIDSPELSFDVAGYEGLRLTEVSRRYSSLSTSMTIVGDRSKWKKLEDVPEDAMSKPFEGGGIAIMDKVKISTLDTVKLFTNDIKRGSAARVKEWMNKNPAWNDYYSYGYRGQDRKRVLVLGGPDAIVQKFLANLPGSTLEKISEMNPAAPQRARRKALVRLMNDVCKRDGTVSVTKLSEEEIDLNDGGFYVITKNGRPNALLKGEVFKDQWDSAVDHQLIDPSKMKIVVAPESVSKAIGESEGDWKCLMTHIRSEAKKKFDLLLTDKKLILGSEALRLNNSGGFRQQLARLRIIMKCLPQGHAVSKVVQEFDEALKSAGDYHNLKRFADDYSFPLPPGYEGHTLLDRFDNVTKNCYPMLELFSKKFTYHDMTTDDALHIVDYMNICDSLPELFRATLPQKSV